MYDMMVVKDKVVDKLYIDVELQFTEQTGKRLYARLREQIYFRVRTLDWIVVRLQLEELLMYDMNNVWDQVSVQVSVQVWDQVSVQVSVQVWDQVNDQVMIQVWDPVRNNVMDHVWNQVWDQVREQLDVRYE